MAPASMPAQDPTTLATRLLESHFRTREAFTRVLGPVLRAQHDLDLRDYMILRWIDQQDLTPGELAQILHVPGYATSRLLDPFIKRDLVVRVVDHADARRYRLHLTDQGRTVVEAINREVTTLLGRVLHDLGPDRAQLLVDSLDAFSHLEGNAVTSEEARGDATR